MSGVRAFLGPANGCQAKVRANMGAKMEVQLAHDLGKPRTTD